MKCLYQMNGGRVLWPLCMWQIVEHVTGCVVVVVVIAIANAPTTFQRSLCDVVVCSCCCFHGCAHVYLSVSELYWLILSNTLIRNHYLARMQRKYPRTSVISTSQLVRYSHILINFFIFYLKQTKRKTIYFPFRISVLLYKELNCSVLIQFNQ